MAASASAFMAGSQVIGGVAGFSAASGQGRIITKQAELEQSALNHQADMTEMQAKDILASVDEDVLLRQQQVSQMIGTQKTSLAGQGVVVDGEIGQALEDQEKKILREDTQALKANAWRQAYGLEMRAQDFRNKSIYTGIEARHKAGMKKAQSYMDLGSSLTSAATTLATDPFRSKKKIPKKVNKSTAYSYSAASPREIIG